MHIHVGYAPDTTARFASLFIPIFFSVSLIIILFVSSVLLSFFYPLRLIIFSFSYFSYFYYYHSICPIISICLYFFHLIHYHLIRFINSIILPIPYITISIIPIVIIPIVLSILLSFSNPTRQFIFVRPYFYHSIRPINSPIIHPFHLSFYFYLFSFLSFHSIRPILFIYIYFYYSYHYHSLRPIIPTCLLFLSFLSLSLNPFYLFSYSIYSYHYHQLFYLFFYHSPIPYIPISVILSLSHHSPVPYISIFLLSYSIYSYFYHSFHCHSIRFYIFSYHSPILPILSFLFIPIPVTPSISYHPSIPPFLPFISIYFPSYHSIPPILSILLSFFLFPPSVNPSLYSPITLLFPPSAYPSAIQWNRRFIA